MDRISPDLEKNRQWVEETFQNCDDILHRQVFLNNGKDEGILVYVEVAVSNLMLEEHVIGLSDVQPLTTYEEGEAALLAGDRKLDNLIAFTDYNKMQIDGYVGDVNTLDPLEDKWKAFGWDVQSVDGHDIQQILYAIDNAK